MPKQNRNKPKNKRNRNSNFKSPLDTSSTNDPRNSPDNFKAEFAAEWRENAIANINKQSNEEVDK